MTHEIPLVSIVVVTYNSSEFVLETLESAYNQTYENIELIISDDGSKDLTVELCKEWIEKKKGRFKRVELLTVEKNTGIAPNCNRGVKTSNGIWIKLIAGDDKLIENCVEKCINFSKENDAKVLFVSVLVNGLEPKNNPKEGVFFSTEDADEQYELLKYGNLLSAPGAFLKKEIIEHLNFFDERFPMLEDYPFFLKALKNKIKFYRINEYLVDYRVENNSVSNSSNLNVNYLHSKILFYRKILINEIKDDFVLKTHYFLELFIMKSCIKGLIKDRKTYYFILRLLSPYIWRIRLSNLNIL